MTENNATQAIAPEVSIGCATFKGKNASVTAYNKKAIPYRNIPNHNGQFASAARGSVRLGSLLGGVIANFIRTLAEALENMPRIKMSHFMLFPLSIGDNEKLRNQEHPQ